MLCSSSVFHFYLKLFHWDTVDFPCCVNFCCTAKWFRHTYINILFKHILSYYGLSLDMLSNVWFSRHIWFPVLCQFLLNHKVTLTCTYITLCLTWSPIMFCLKWLDTVPRAEQPDPTAFPLPMPECASINHKLPIHPVPSPSPAANTCLLFKSMDLCSVASSYQVNNCIKEVIRRKKLGKNLHTWRLKTMLVKSDGSVMKSKRKL